MGGTKAILEKSKLILLRYVHVQENQHPVKVLCSENYYVLWPEILLGGHRDNGWINIADETEPVHNDGNFSEFRGSGPMLETFFFGNIWRLLLLTSLKLVRTVKMS